MLVAQGVGTKALTLKALISGGSGTVILSQDKWPHRRCPSTQPTPPGWLFWALHTPPNSQAPIAGGAWPAGGRGEVGF